MRLTSYFTAPLILCLGLLIAACSHSPEQPSQSSGTAQDQSPLPNTLSVPEQLLKQAQRGDLDSQFQLGSLFFTHKPKNDLKQAEYWWKQAADKGHTMAAVSLAYLYTGRDNPDFGNSPLMIKYLNQSAAGGNSMAQHILGSLYLSGEQGVAQDTAQARRLFQSACQNNYTASCEALENLAQ